MPIQSSEDALSHSTVKITLFIKNSERIKQSENVLQKVIEKRDKY